MLSQYRQIKSPFAHSFQAVIMSNCDFLLCVWLLSCSQHHVPLKWVLWGSPSLSPLSTFTPHPLMACSNSLSWSHVWLGLHAYIPTTAASAATPNSVCLIWLNFRICIKETVTTEHDKCTEILNPSVPFLQRHTDARDQGRDLLYNSNLEEPPSDIHI